MNSTSKSSKSPPTPSNSDTNTFTMNSDEGPEFTNLVTHHQHQHHFMDWLEDSITFLPSFLDEPYSTTTTDTHGYEWWSTDLSQSPFVQTPVASATPIPTNLSTTTTPTTIGSPPPPQAELSKKRKLPTSTTQRRRAAVANGEEEDVEVQRKPGCSKKTNGKGSMANGEVRWAEQLLNPCAAAIDARNPSRIQHLLYVLQELASLSGDANHRLAAHGLRSLTLHFPEAGIPVPQAVPSFAFTEPKLFRSALIRFHEISPWFALPNALANSSILQTATAGAGLGTKTLHVIDVGVSHGVQWPTLLEALTRRPASGGASAPSRVRLTVAGAAAAAAPFSTAPSGYDFSLPLLRYAKSINLNLRIEQANDLGAISASSDETLVVCIQFRAQQLADEFLQALRNLKPDLVVLSEIDGGVGEGRGLGFTEGFGRKAELLWRFLDSTGAAFKGRDCAERRVVEGEAARMLEGAVAEGRGKWRERMVEVGFREEAFGEEAVDVGRSLLRKYDGNWEMRSAPAPPAPPGTAAPAAAVGLWWKGQPVSFCSLWKPVKKDGGSLRP